MIEGKLEETVKGDGGEAEAQTCDIFGVPVIR